MGFWLSLRKLFSYFYSISVNISLTEMKFFILGIFELNSIGITPNTNFVTFTGGSWHSYSLRPLAGNSLKQLRTEQTSEMPRTLGIQTSRVQKKLFTRLKKLNVTQSMTLQTAIRMGLGVMSHKMSRVTMLLQIFVKKARGQVVEGWTKKLHKRQFIC